MTVTCSKVTNSVTLSLETENESSHVRIICTSMFLEIRNEALMNIHVCMQGRKEFSTLLWANISVIACTVSCLFVSLFDWLTQKITGLENLCLRYLSHQHNLRPSILDELQKYQMSNPNIEREWYHYLSQEIWARFVKYSLCKADLKTKKFKKCMVLLLPKDFSFFEN